MVDLVFLDKLKTETLGLIIEYNGDSTHRRLEPIKGYGDLLGKTRAYWAFWHHDNHSTDMIGLTYVLDADSLYAVDDLKNSISADTTIDNFKSQLKKIPLK